MENVLNQSGYELEQQRRQRWCGLKGHITGMLVMAADADRIDLSRHIKSADDADLARRACDHLIQQLIHTRDQIQAP